jgi:Uma2 family endonuclease
MVFSQRTYERVVLEDPDGQWELHRGRLREKPGGTARHNRVMLWLAAQILEQVDPANFDVRCNGGRARRADETSYIPDVMVIPTSLVRPFLERWDVLEVYDASLPFVAEVWSPSTGAYDIDAKLPEYQRRGDAEIWRVHPFDRTVTTWRRRPDGAYDEEVYRGGMVDLFVLPGVHIDLDALFG